MLRYQLMSTMKSITLLLIMFFFFCCCYSQPTQQPSGYRLAQQWPSAFCNLNPAICDRNQLHSVINFTIHGLWPYDSKGQSIPPCQGSNFDVSMVENIRDELNEAWPTFNIRDMGNEDFWKYEWEKHGKCSESLLDGKSYFDTALHLKNKFDIFKTLQDAGIVPDDRSYSPQDVFDAISKKLNFEPELSCQVNANGKLLLKEVYLCVDQLGQQFVNCGFKGKSCFLPQYSNHVVFIALASA